MEIPGKSVALEEAKPSRSCSDAGRQAMGHNGKTNTQTVGTRRAFDGQLARVKDYK